MRDSADTPDRSQFPAPRASARTHLLAAGLLWSTTGSVMVAAGIYKIVAAGASPIPWILLAAAGGIVKARLVLRRAARRIADRIEARGDGRCIGGFLSWKTWLLVISMAAMGRFLRTSPLPPLPVGVVGTAVGIALAAASLHIWGRWRSRAAS